MGEMIISYETAQERHPSQVSTILNLKLKTKSKFGGMNPKDMQWEYRVEVDQARARYFTMAAVCGIKQEKTGTDKRIEEMIRQCPLDEQVKYYLKDMQIFLRGKAGTWCGRDKIKDSIPPEVIHIYQYVVDPDLGYKESIENFNQVIDAIKGG